MEIGSINNSMQLSQLIDSASSKDQGNFASFLQAARDKLLHGAQDNAINESNLGKTGTAGATTASTPIELPNAKTNDPLQQAFEDFVGQTFFAELIKSYRSTQQPAPYFNGGRAEQIFQGQLDQILAEQLSKRSADKIADPMYERFMARRPA